MLLLLGCIGAKSYHDIQLLSALSDGYRRSFRIQNDRIRSDVNDSHSGYGVGLDHRSLCSGSDTDS